MAAADLADDVHHFGRTRLVAALVDDRQRHVVEPLRQRARAHHAAHVGADHHQILARVTRLDIGGHRRGGEEVVGRDVEEALDLARVEVDREHPVGARLGDQVGDQLGRNRRARAGLAVLPGITEIGDHRGDPLGTRAPQRVDADQQLHQVVVRGETRRLDDEHVLPADVFVDLDENLLVGETAYAGVDQRQLEILRDRAGERQVRVAGHELHRGFDLCGFRGGGIGEGGLAAGARDATVAPGAHGGLGCGRWCGGSAWRCFSERR